MHWTLEKIIFDILEPTVCKNVRDPFCRQPIFQGVRFEHNQRTHKEHSHKEHTHRKLKDHLEHTQRTIRKHTEHTHKNSTNTQSTHIKTQRTHREHTKNTQRTHTENSNIILIEHTQRTLREHTKNNQRSLRAHIKNTQITHKEHSLQYVQVLRKVNNWEGDFWDAANQGVGRDETEHPVCQRTGWLSPAPRAPLRTPSLVRPSVRIHMSGRCCLCTRDGRASLLCTLSALRWGMDMCRGNIGNFPMGNLDHLIL